MATPEGRLGIICGGGPAPGMNGVISAAGIEALDRGCQVVGLYDGFSSILDGAVNPDSEEGPFRLLGYPDLTAIHWEGGTILRTSRRRPADDELPEAVENLKRLNIRYLLTIGGDDTLSSSVRLAEAAGGDLAIAHIPKTIDNDLPLPANTPTFGFNTARQTGTEIVKALLYDAKATRRWFLPIVMGRSAGHLALSIAVSAGVTCAIIPEEFRTDAEITVDDLADIIIGSMLVRRSKPGRSRYDGVAIVAEGVCYKLAKSELERLQEEKLARISYDEHGHIRLSDIQLGRAIQDSIHKRVGKDYRFEGGAPLTMGVVAKNVGYELRCCPPTPFDIEYTRNLGYAGAKFLLNGGTHCMITLVNGDTRPRPYEEIFNKVTGKVDPRLVDITSDSYEVARKYMLRLERQHLEKQDALDDLCRVSGMDGDQLRSHFQRMFDLQAARIKPS